MFRGSILYFQVALTALMKNGMAAIIANWQQKVFTFG